MAEMNMVVLGGLVQKDPVVGYFTDKKTGEEKCRAKFFVETKNAFQGQRKAEWLPCVAFEGTAEYIREYAKAGDPCLVRGRLAAYRYRQGNTVVHKSECVVMTFQLQGEKPYWGFKDIKFGEKADLPDDLKLKPPERAAPKVKAPSDGRLSTGGKLHKKKPTKGKPRKRRARKKEK
jgi:single-stranded DNA-binding protein